MYAGIVGFVQIGQPYFDPTDRRYKSKGRISPVVWYRAPVSEHEIGDERGTPARRVDDLEPFFHLQETQGKTR